MFAPRPLQISIGLLAGLAAVTRSTSVIHAAELPIQIEVAMERGAGGGVAPQWAKLLGELGLSPVRLRGATRNDRPAVETIKFADGERLKVTGVLNRRNQLELPGG
ncbi:MAG: hypothetical protein AAF961_09920, partial [Planctomycetota bacterium]